MTGLRTGVQTPKTLMPSPISVFLTSPAQAHPFEQEVLGHWREMGEIPAPCKKCYKNVFI